MSSQLLSKIRTLEERDQLISELDLLLASLYQTGAFERILKSQTRLWVSEIIRKEIPKEIPGIESYLKQIRHELDDLKILKVKLAFEPTDISVDKFYSYLSGNSDKKMILDLEIDTGILGGALISSDGEYRDFSLKRLFEEEYDKKEKDLLKMMYSKVT